MPSRQRGDLPPLNLSLCRRCQINDPTITVRTEPLCQACFSKYVASKVVKRMESFRVRNADPNAQRTLILPLSFGHSSLSLLHILSRHMKGQMERTRRTGYKLHVCHVRHEDSDVDHDDDDDDARAQSILDRIQAEYPEHSYSTAALSDAFEIPDVERLFPASELAPHNDARTRLRNVLLSLPSATARADLSIILRRKVLVDVARRQACEAILWADSTTRLAERTLAETAKGRGAALPSFVSDGDATFGLPFYYPMRDLLSKEIVAFAGMMVEVAAEVGLGEDAAEEGDAGAMIPSVVNSKNMTIDALMRQYFASVEREYPSIVANVVKTSGKLEKKSLSGEIEDECELCQMQLNAETAPTKSRVCHACIRTLPQSA